MPDVGRLTVPWARRGRAAPRGARTRRNRSQGEALAPRRRADAARAAGGERSSAATTAGPDLAIATSPYVRSAFACNRRPRRASTAARSVRYVRLTTTSTTSSSCESHATGEPCWKRPRRPSTPAAHLTSPHHAGPGKALSTVLSRGSPASGRVALPGDRRQLVASLPRCAVDVPARRSPPYVGSVVRPQRVHLSSRGTHVAYMSTTSSPNNHGV